MSLIKLASAKPSKEEALENYQKYNRRVAGGVGGIMGGAMGGALMHDLHNNRKIHKAENENEYKVDSKSIEEFFILISIPIIDSNLVSHFVYSTLIVIKVNHSFLGHEQFLSLREMLS